MNINSIIEWINAFFMNAFNLLVSSLEFINPVVWAITNLIVGYVGLMLAVFVVVYPALFNPKLTTGGQMIFRFSLSLFFVVVIVVVGLFIDPRHDLSWYEFPGDTIWWRPVLRLGAYSYVAYTITALVWFLWKRKFRPEKLKTAPDKLLVKPRHDTAEIPTLKENKS